MGWAPRTRKKLGVTVPAITETERSPNDLFIWVRFSAAQSVRVRLRSR